MGLLMTLKSPELCICDAFCLNSLTNLTHLNHSEAMCKLMTKCDFLQCFADKSPGDLNDILSPFYIQKQLNVSCLLLRICKMSKLNSQRLKQIKHITAENGIEFGHFQSVPSGISVKRPDLLMQSDQHDRGNCA